MKKFLFMFYVFTSSLLASFRRLTIKSNHLITNPIRHRLLGVEEAVALGIFLDLFGGLAGALGHHIDQRLLGLEDLLGLDLNVGGLSVHASERLVDHHLRIGQDEAFSLASGHEDNRSAAFGAAD